MFGDKFDVNKINNDIIKRILNNIDNQSSIYKSLNGDYNLLFVRRNGKAYVPISPSSSISKRLKDRLRTGERREDDIEIYEKAAFAEPMVWRSILLIGKWALAWGYTFGFLNKYNRKRNREQNKILDFFTNWSEYVYYTYRMFAVIVSMVLYGDSYVEKIYDDKGSILNDGTGWGIRDLKVIYTPTIAEERDEFGKTIMYWQKPPSYLGNDLKKIKKMGGIPLQPHTIVHYKWNDVRNKTYGISDLKSLIDVVSMKVGIREDMTIMIQQKSNPMIAWLVGDAENPPPDGFLSALSSYLSANADGQNDFVLPGFIKPQVVGTGEKMPDITPSLQLLSSEIIKGIGVPEVLLGEGNDTTEATARIQIESFIGDIKFIQNYINDKNRREIFVDIIDPQFGKNKVGRPKSRDYIDYDTFIRTPSVISNPIIPVDVLMDKVSILYEKGLITTQEAREMIGELSLIDTNDRSAFVKSLEAQIEQGARELDIRVDEINTRNNQSPNDQTTQKFSFP